MKSHRTDSVSLFFGLAFLMIAIGYLAKVYLKLDLPSMGWFIAAGLIFLGLAGAITALIPSRKAGPEPAIEPETKELQVEDADAERAR
ncbi:MAG TPA: hypothetical protein VFC19_44420 [Candidatus Limnocylindrales bacterium]|nr:hypothetical protein [Candidatus Limnocylindrales bacterium]